ncbi:MAG: TRAP transporter small permease [Pseudomonadota bacterium]
MIRRLSRLVQWIEDGALVLVLVGLIGLASLQILLRNGFDTGVAWGDEAIRLMVLWLAVLGAVAASRGDRHIRIDILGRLLPPRLKLVAALIVDVFTIAVLCVLTWHASRFVRDAIEFEDRLLDGLPAWWFQLILPVGFGLMALHQLAVALLRVVGKAPTSEPGSTETP